MAKNEFAVVVLFFCLGLCASASAQSDSEGAGESTMDLPDCPVALASRGDPTPYSTEPFECYCSEEARKARGAYAFGSGPYEGLSNICMAALHAGVTGKQGGDVRVVPGPNQNSFTGTLANGVYSSDWDYPSQFGSFTVEPTSNP